MDSFGGANGRHIAIAHRINGNGTARTGRIHLDDEQLPVRRFDGTPDQSRTVRSLVEQLDTRTVGPNGEQSARPDITVAAMGEHDPAVAENRGRSVVSRVMRQALDPPAVAVDREQCPPLASVPSPAERDAVRSEVEGTGGLETGGELPGARSFG